MRSINALSLTPATSEWLTSTHHPRILHIFDAACNLINEHGEVLSVVTPQIGNGPFNLVIKEDGALSKKLSIESPISIEAGEINLGDLNIKTIDANAWNPRPHWELLYEKRDSIIRNLAAWRIPNDLPSIPESLLMAMASAIANADLPASIASASRLAGLGQGLTPAGDDFLMGAMHAAWIVHQHKVAATLTKEVANAATPLTASLSAAWLRSAGRGEAGILWHEFFNALVSFDRPAIHDSVNKIVAVGETSGADALAGFVDVLVRWGQQTGSKSY